MKELTVEEKAQRYDEAKVRMSRAFNSNRCTIGFMNEIFPELKESEDEKIRKWLIAQLELKSDVNNSRELELMILKSIAWLEKQGESTDINPSEFDLRLNKLLKQFETLSKEELASSLSFYLNVVQNDGTYKDEEKQGEQNPIINVPSREVILAIWDLGNEWKELTNGSISTEYGTQLDYIQKHWHESEYYLREKQGEQNPADKLEPKFKVGDWIVQENIGVYKVIEVCESWYEVIDIEDNHYSISFDKEYMCHLWTIEDAKYGDVLTLSYASQNYILVYKGLYEEGLETKMSVFCFYSVKEDTYYDETDSFHAMNTGEVITPSTKEQRDTLEKAMANARYTFDFEKKELKNIEQKSTEWSLPYGKNETAEHLIALAECIEMEGDCLFNRLTGEDYGKLLRVLARELTQPKQEWSEEDIRNINDIDSVLFYDKDLPEDTCVRLRNWLESLKPQNNITDEELAQAKKDAYNDAIDKIEYHSGEPTFDDGWSAAIDYIRKKSLKPQSHWKPTEAQLASLTIACDRNDRLGFDLTQLLKELKKL